MTSPMILIDLDATLADWRSRFEEGMRRLHPGLDLPPVGRFSVWGDDPNRNAAVREVVTEPGFYAQLAPFAGARTALIEMLHAGFEVILLSTPMESNVTSASEKSHWVARNLGRRFRDRLILSHDKTVVRGDLLVDDKPVITGRMVPTWQRVYFDQPWNAEGAEGISGTPRLSNWADWERVLVPLLREPR